MKRLLLCVACFAVGFGFDYWLSVGRAQKAWQDGYGAAQIKIAHDDAMNGIGELRALLADE